MSNQTIVLEAIDDVDDFVLAISCYSRAINIKPHHPVILSNRCAAYLRICQFLLHRPPSDSEYRPLSGLDPTIHAGLALKDADKMMNLQSDSVKAHILKADALILLQRFEQAHGIVLSGLQIDPSSVTLNNIIQKNFPEEYAERKLEHENLTTMGADLLPLFVMDVVLPCQKLQLNIFEPRYRLMVEGRRRCHIIDNWDQDGYRVAEIEWIQDICPAEGTEERLDLQDTIQKAESYAKSWMRTAQEAAQGDQVRLAQLHKAEELMPTTNDPEHFSFWLATLTNRRPSERLDLLRMRDTNERVKRGLIYLKAEEQFCRLQ